MSRSIVGGVTVLLLLLFSGVAQAHVTSGSNCGNCHGTSTGHATITSTLTTNGADDPGVVSGLKLFEANPGETVMLPISITNAGSSGDRYAVVLRGLRNATTDSGVLNAANIMTFVPDATYTARGTGTSSYAYRGPITWTGVAANYTYALSISASTPPDYYLLNFGVAGAIDGSTWAQQQDIVVHVTPVPEPGSIGAMGIAMGALVLRRRHAASSSAG